MDLRLLLQLQLQLQLNLFHSQKHGEKSNRLYWLFSLFFSTPYFAPQFQSGAITAEVIFLQTTDRASSVSKYRHFSYKSHRAKFVTNIAIYFLFTIFVKGFMGSLCDYKSQLETTFVKLLSNMGRGSFFSFDVEGSIL